MTPSATLRLENVRNIPTECAEGGVGGVGFNPPHRYYDDVLCVFQCMYTYIYMCRDIDIDLDIDIDIEIDIEFHDS